MRRQKGLLLPSALLVGVLGLWGAGCKEEYSDEAFGVLDLSSVYENSSPGSELTEVPTQIPAQVGWLDDQQAEYYDFGLVSALQDDLTGKPIGVRVAPMYFFFTPQGYPLFSTPVREKRDGSDSMPGGKGVLKPNPVDFCELPGAVRPACDEENKNEQRKPYPARLRDLLVDPRRNSADYQRPIVDVTPADDNPNRPTYTGLWEVIEIIAPGGYEPDSIKHASTLERAVASKTFRRRSTQKVVNCPMMDERTYVPRGVTDRPTPRPRIELWYRRKLTFCFLANGWETLGNQKGELFYADSDEERVDTFDVARLVFGPEKTQTRQIMVPISRMFVPAIFTDDQAGSPPAITRIGEQFISEGRPRRFKNDPPGYSPLRWMWDLPVPHDYEWGALKSVTSVDMALAGPRVPIAVQNIPLRGVAVPCSHPPVTTKRGPRGPNSYYCGVEVKNPEDPEGDTIVDARGDARCNALGLECNKESCICDAPFVGYGQACGPGIAQCSPEKDKFSEFGYFCFPAYGGFCHLRCSGMNTRAMENKDKKPTEFVDTRCKEIVGYSCLRYLGQGICLKFCDQNVTETNQCSAATTVGTEMTDIGEGQTCQDWGLEVCTWPETYTPKN